MASVGAEPEMKRQAFNARNWKDILAGDDQSRVTRQVTSPCLLGKVSQDASHSVENHNPSRLRGLMGYEVPDNRNSEPEHLSSEHQSTDKPPWTKHSSPRKSGRRTGNRWRDHTSHEHQQQTIYKINTTAYGPGSPMISHIPNEQAGDTFKPI